MKNLTEKFLTETDKKKIMQAVQEVEKVTSGEIVPMIVSSSYTYPVSNIIGAFTFSMVISLAAIAITNNQNLWLFLCVFMLGFIIMHEIINMVPPLKRLFISDKEIEEEVNEAAMKAFYYKSIYKTRDLTGILIFISIFEKKVVLLADQGINAKVSKKNWEETVEIITHGIKNKTQADAIITAIHKTKDLLKKYFPIKHGDTNELDNLIIEKK